MTVNDALDIARRGWHVLPCWWIENDACACGTPKCAAEPRSRGKHPITPNGQLDATTDEGTIRGWFEKYPHMNLAVALDPSGFMALDVDHPDGPEAALDKVRKLELTLGPLPATVITITGSGNYHFWFRKPAHPIRGLLGDITVRGRNYVVIPPSSHRSGGTYRWLVGPSDIAVAELPAAWSEALRKEEVVGTAGMPAEAEEPAWLRAVPQDVRIARMREHLAKESGEVMGKSTQGLAFIVACQAARGFAVRDPNAVLAAMLEWNRKCVPPYDEHEIARRVASAYVKAHLPAWGAKFESAGFLAAMQAAPASSSLVTAPVATTTGVSALANIPPPTLYGVDVSEFMGAGEDADDEEGMWLVRGLIPEAMPTMIAGPAKARKSWLTLYLAVCIAAGRDALGLKTRRGRVLVISREDGIRETKRRLWRIARGLGITADDLKGWLRVDAVKPLYLDRAEDVNALGASLAEFRPAVVTIDCLSRVHLQDENSRSQMAIVMNVWADLCSRYACSVVLLHHVIKWGVGPLIQRIRGSGDIGATLRWAIGVTKVAPDTAKIETDGNLPPLVDDLAIRYVDRVVEGKAQVEIGRVTDAEVRAAKVRRAARDLRPLVMEAFKAQGRFDSASKLATAIGKAKADVLFTVNALVTEGVLDRVGDKLWLKTTTTEPAPTKVIDPALAGLAARYGKPEGES